MTKPVVLVWLTICGSVSLGASDFDKSVLPILRANCVPCHDDTNRSSGFAVSSEKTVLAGGARHGAAVVAGKPDDSPLIQLLRGKMKPQMPMGKVLGAPDIAAIEKWVLELKPESTQAAKKPYWAFVKPAKHDPPAVPGLKSTSEIDAFVAARLAEKGLTMAPEADRRTLVRRLYFDLIGLPPTPKEVKAFVESESPTAYQDLVNSLLADPRYGERWGRHWLDLARYADTNGYEGDPEWSHAWRYRNYVIDAFNQDKPYDQFIKEQIAGDEFFEVVSAVPAPPPEPEKAVALSFLRLAPFNRTPVSDENRDSWLSEMTSTVGSVFLGLTVGCAKCHDHKYDSVPQRDFYRMKAFFATVQVPSTGRAGGALAAEFYRPGEKEWADKRREEKKKELAAAQAAFDEFLKPMIVKVAEFKRATDPKFKGEATAKDVEKEVTADNNNALGFDKKPEVFSAEEKRDWRGHTDTIGRLKKAIDRLEPLCMGLTNADGPPFGPSVPATYIQIRGEYDHLGEKVEPGFLSAIEGHSNPAVLKLDRYKMFPSRGRRMTLAEWIARPENPLTARVMVNRIWQYHFGRGIVETSSDFGRNGTPPTNPELLDWLALRFVDEKWSIKQMHRLVLNSAVYKQTSRREDAKAAESDPDDRLLWRFPRQRLSGEALRDTVLAVSGRLNLEEGGLPIYPPLPEGLDEEQKVQGVNTWETSHGPDSRRRSIYIFQRRAMQVPFLETFDAPVLNAPCERRRNSITALQALTMYDSDFVNGEVSFLADRIRSETGPDPREQVRRAFELLLSRPAKPKELEGALKLMAATEPRESALLALCRTLINTSEFIYID